MVRGISSAPALAAIPMMVARAPPNRRAIGPAATAPSTPPTPPMVKRRPITPGEAWTCAHQEEDLDRGGDAAEEVGRGGGGRYRPEEGIPEHEAEAFGDAVHEPRVPALGRRLASARGCGWRRRRRQRRRSSPSRRPPRRSYRWPARDHRRRSARPPRRPARCPVSFALPSTRCSRPTREGRYDW